MLLLGVSLLAVHELKEQRLPDVDEHDRRVPPSFLEQRAKNTIPVTNQQNPIAPDLARASKMFVQQLERAQLPKGVQRRVEARSPTHTCQQFT